MSKVFGERFKKEREKTGLNQGDLAIEFKVSQNTIHMWETGKTEPKYNTLEYIANFFNVTADYLLGRDERPATPERIRSEVAKMLETTGYDQLSDKDKEKYLNISKEVIKNFRK